jgi:acetylcholinesterase
MVVNGGNTEGLFHGAFMQSGAVIPRGDISLGQQDYDALVREAGCTGAEDTLECLRQLPFATLKKAMDMSPGLFSYRVCHDFFDLFSSVENYPSQALNLIWGPRADGTFLKAPFQHMVVQSRVSKIPFVMGNEATYFRCPIVVNPAAPGNCDDEGTLFSLANLNVT